MGAERTVTPLHKGNVSTDARFPQNGRKSAADEISIGENCVI
jgi:hypothetical protein